MRVDGLEVSIFGSGFRVFVLGCRVQGFVVQDLGSWGWDFGFGVEDFEGIAAQD